MNILVVGSGAREHAIMTALHRSPQAPKLYCFGTSINPGIKKMTQHYRVGKITDVDAVVKMAKELQVSLAIIGPEAPLEKGLADALWRSSIPTIGPKQKLAQIETSKSYARDLMQKYHISGLPKYQTFSNLAGVSEFLKELGESGYVVKANGLMGGKGVKVAGDDLKTFEEGLTYCKDILEHGQSLVIEEKLIGQEFSLMCFCDGEHIIPMPVVQDHRRAFVNDKGPNTGGMGSYSDANHSLPFLTEHDLTQAQHINETVYRALMADRFDKYIGVLYGSFIATRRGVYVIEFNARFGDPEALNVLSILESDFVALCQSMVIGDLTLDKAQFASLATVCKYAVPNGYPDAPVTDMPIDICAVKNKMHLYLSSVNVLDGQIYASGARTAAYVGISDNISSAEEIAEREISAIDGPLFHREDIGTDLFIRKRVDEMRKLRAT